MVGVMTMSMAVVGTQQGRLNLEFAAFARVHSAGYKNCISPFRLMQQN